MNLTMQDIRRIRELRYGDGLTALRVADIVGCSRQTVWRYAPGMPGKIPNNKLRAAFKASSVTATGVARAMGWDSGKGADSSRVNRTLGLTPDINGKGNASTRTYIDAETASLMAEAIGVMPWEIMPWEIMPDDETEVAA